MKVIVTGARGFIGQHVLHALVERDWDVYAITRREPPQKDDGVHWIVCDLLDLYCDPTFEERLDEIGATHLLHLAWYAEHGKFWSAEVNFDWVTASMALLRVFQRVGGHKVVFAGSCAEYDWSYGYCKEYQTPCEPASVYGRCKNSLQLLAKAWCDENDIEFCWGRVFLSYGPGEASGRLVPYIIRRLLDGQESVCVNGALYRDLLYVEDVARAFAVLLASDEDNGTFNVCSGEPVRIRDIISTVGQMIDRKCLVRCDKKNNTDEVPMLVGDNSRICSLGWAPLMSLHDGLLSYIRYIKGN